MYIGFIGIFSLLMIAYTLSNNRKAIKFETIIWGLGLQGLLGLIILKIPFVKSQFFFSRQEIGEKTFCNLGPLSN